MGRWRRREEGRTVKEGGGEVAGKREAGGGERGNRKGMEKEVKGGEREKGGGMGGKGVGLAGREGGRGWRLRYGVLRSERRVRGGGKVRRGWG